MSAIDIVREEFRINLAQLTGKYFSKHVRATLTLQAGDIPRYSWPQAPDDNLQFIQEANVGYSPAKDLWIDAGYFLTHIGSDGPIPIRNYLSALSMMSYFEPSYQSGIQIIYKFSDKAAGGLYLINGYNQLTDNNKNKSFGVQLSLHPSDNLSFVYNNITGNEQPSDLKGKLRFFNNLIMSWKPLERLEVFAGADLCLQDYSDLSDSTSSATMNGQMAGIKYSFAKNFSGVIRFENYSDKNGILSALYKDVNNKDRGLSAIGYSAGLQFNPLENAYVRAEVRYLRTPDEIPVFSDGAAPRNDRMEVMITSGVSF